MIPYPNSTEQARFIIYRAGEHLARYFRPAVPPNLRAQLTAMPAAAIFDAPETVQTLLASPAHWVGQAYTFTRAPDTRSSPAVMVEAGAFVVRQNGGVVTRAWSVRENTRAAEVAVETLPAHRQQGWARQATCVWATAVLLSGRTPFFSHTRHNLASAALARSLNLTPFAEGAAFD